MNNTYPQVESRRIDIPAETATSVDLKVGDAIRGVRGQIWLTQEKDSRDYCLVAGVSFCADRGGRAVLSAIEEGAAVIVERRDVALARGMFPGFLKIDSLEELTRRAKRAQGEWIASMLANVTRGLRGHLRATSHAARRPARDIRRRAA